MTTGAEWEWIDNETTRGSAIGVGDPRSRGVGGGTTTKDAPTTPAPSDLHGWRRALAWTQAHIGPILLVVIPALPDHGAIPDR